MIQARRCTRLMRAEARAAGCGIEGKSRVDRALTLDQQRVPGCRRPQPGLALSLLPCLAPANSGSVHIFVTASRAELA
jgi:hypothetical protein